MNATLAISRVLGLEKKNRKQIPIQIEKEYDEIILNNHLERSDIVNLSLQRFVNCNGIPVALIAACPGGMEIKALSKSDVINISLGELFKEKGYCH
jgi:hypothetical protein